MNGTARYNLQLESDSAIMVNICITAGGHIEMYISTFIPNPNSALHEYYLDLDYEDYDDDMLEVCGSTVVDLKRQTTCGFPPKDGTLRRRSSTDRTSVYLSIVSKAEFSIFTVTMNDTSVQYDPDAPKEGNIL